MLSSAGLERVHGVEQLYIKRDGSRRFGMLAAKVTDDLLLAGNRDVLQHFISSFKALFTVRKYIIDDEILFNGGTITPLSNGGA